MTKQPFAPGRFARLVGEPRVRGKCQPKRCVMPGTKCDGRAGSGRLPAFSFMGTPQRAIQGFVNFPLPPFTGSFHSSPYGRLPCGVSFYAAPVPAVDNISLAVFTDYLVPAGVQDFHGCLLYSGNLPVRMYTKIGSFGMWYDHPLPVPL